MQNLEDREKSGEQVEGWVEPDEFWSLSEDGGDNPVEWKREKLALLEWQVGGLVRQKTICELVK